MPLRCSCLPRLPASIIPIIAGMAACRYYARMALLPSQRNKVLEAVRSAGFDASEFEWVEVETSLGEYPTKLQHTSGYYYSFQIKNASLWYASYTPGKQRPVGHSTVFRDWDDHLKWIPTWLINLRREIDAPDLWGLLSQEKPLVEAASNPEVGNTPFSVDEQQYISAQLNEVREFLFKTHDPSEEHRKFVIARLNYLAKAAASQGRVDWLNIMIGTFVGIIAKMAMSSEAAHELLRFVTNALSQLFGGTPMLPPV